MFRRLNLLAAAICVAMLGLNAVAQTDAELAKQTQNPVADLISLPLQNNFNMGTGPGDEMQYTLNIQPVIPMPLGEDWNVIHRIIAPLMYIPELAPGVGKEWGFGDTLYEAFFSPKEPTRGITWGLGPIVQLPTAKNELFGSEEWGAGPALVALGMPGNWVIGSTIYNLWSLDADAGNEVNYLLWQYFVNYNLPSGAYLTSAPIITANWEAKDSDNRWTIPFGLGAGRIFRMGDMPVNTSLHGYYNVEAPENAADWQIRFQVQLLFPR